MNLSAFLITHNEEKVITRALESIYDWVDEIVVVDGASTDQTVAKIKDFDKNGKIKIFIEENPSNFIINKQKALERCQGRWILELDADEIIPENLQKEIQSILNKKTDPIHSDQFNQSQQPIAYHIPRLNHFLGQPLKKGGQYPDYTLRLYQKAYARFPLKTVHDQVEISDDQFQPTPTNSNRLQLIATLKWPILHYPYPRFEVYLRKWIQYSEFEAEELYKKRQTLSFSLFLKYMILSPVSWFFKTYFRHKGFQDGLAGLIFSLFSAIRYWVIYIKLVEKSRQL